MSSLPPPGAYGRYQLLGSIGRGSVAEVHKAKSFGVEGFEKTLVVKRIHKRLAEVPAFVDAFVRESKLVVRLSHANVVQVFDLGRVEEPGGPSYFMAMEYVAGLTFETLLGRLRDSGEAPAPELCVYVAAEVAKALDHAHRRRDEQLRLLGMVHGDVGPGNVLVSWDGEVKLGDFGIARAVLDPRSAHAIDPVTRARKLARSSPEQANGEPVDATSDVFSLGTLLYEALGGAPPFVGDDPEEVGRAVAEARFEPLETVRPGLDAGLCGIVARMLAARSEDRVESAARCYEDLLAYLYASGTRFGASELGELVDRFREAPPRMSGIESVLARSELHSLAETTPAHGTPVSHVSPPPASRRATAPPPAPPAVRTWTNGQVQHEVSSLVVRFAGRAPVPPPMRERARQILMRYGARVLAESSRELSAMFGLQQVDGRDTENAVRCGLVLVRGLATSNVQPSVGIDAGPLRLRADCEPVDDAASRALVTSARRLSGLAEQRVAISESAARNLRGLFDLEAAPTAVASGRALLVGEVRPPQEAFGRFVGRKRELRQLGEALSQASRRAIQVVGVAGAHGIGKTRLLYEMERRISRGSFNIGCYIAPCPPEGRDAPHSAVVAMLRTLCGVREGDPPDRIAAVAPRLRALGLRDEEVQAVLGELGAVRPDGAPSGAPLGSAVTRMLASLAEDRVHVLAWDNAHALDAASATLLSTVVERLPQARLMLVFASRVDGDRFRWLPGCRTIELPDLDDDDVLRLVGLRIGADQVPEALVDFVRARAGGHPMFIEELLYEAVESGAIVVKDAHIDALHLDGELAVPRPLRTLLGDRVQRLPEPERNLLLAATVLGEPVDVSVLSSMLEAPIGTVNALVESLEGRDLVHRDGPVTISFYSPLLPEVVLGDIAPEVRLDLHRQAANAYQMVLGERTEELASHIAYHLAEAGEHDRAAGFFATSGLFFLDARRLDRAVVDLTRALELADLALRSGEELTEWVAALSTAVRHVRSGASLPQLVTRLAAHLDDHPDIDARERVQITVDLAQIAGALHRYEQAKRLLERATADAEAWPELARSALMAEAEIAIRNGEFKIALAAVERAGKLPAGDATEQHRLLVATAQAFGGAGEHDRGLAALDEAAVLAPDDVVHATERAKVRALILGFRGDWRGCAVECEKGAERARAAGLMHEVAVNLHNQGDALMRLEELPRAYAALEASRTVAEELGADRLVNLNRLMLAYLDALNGSAPARQSLSEHLAQAEAQRWTWDAITGRYLLGRLLVRRGNIAAAKRELGAALKLARSVDNRLVAEDCERELARLR